jgi:hypothetical protein
VATDVGVDERAQRDDPKVTSARIVERAGDQRRSETASLECLVDFGVEEREHIAAPFAVDQFACVPAAHEELVPSLVRPMHNGDVVRLHVSTVPLRPSPDTRRRLRHGVDERCA